MWKVSLSTLPLIWWRPKCTLYTFPGNEPWFDDIFAAIKSTLFSADNVTISQKAQQLRTQTKVYFIDISINHALNLQFYIILYMMFVLRHMVSVVHVLCIVQSWNTNGPVKCQSSSVKEEKTKTIYVMPKKIVMGIKPFRIKW